MLRKFLGWCIRRSTSHSSLNLGMSITHINGSNISIVLFCCAIEIWVGIWGFPAPNPTFFYPVVDIGWAKAISCKVISIPTFLSTWEEVPGKGFVLIIVPIVIQPFWLLDDWVVGLVFPVIHLGGYWGDWATDPIIGIPFASVGPLPLPADWETPRVDSVTCYFNSFIYVLICCIVYRSSCTWASFSNSFCLIISRCKADSECFFIISSISFLNHLRSDSLRVCS